MEWPPEVEGEGQQNLGTADSFWASTVLFQLASTHLSRTRGHSCPVQCRHDPGLPGRAKDPAEVPHEGIKYHLSLHR